MVEQGQKHGKNLSERAFSAFGGFKMAQNDGIYAGLCTFPAQNPCKLRWFWAMYASKWPQNTVKTSDCSSSSLQEWPQTTLFIVYFFCGGSAEKRVKFEVSRLQKWSKNCKKPGKIVSERFFWLLEISSWPKTTVVWKVPDYL